MNCRSLLILLFTVALAHAQSGPGSREAELKWFDEARFGMFIHWGPYTVPAGERNGKPVWGLGEWIMRNGQIPVAEYKSYAPQFTGAKYDPVAWAKLAKAAGMKYVVITSKHHDGFSLYDSTVSEWDVMNSGAKRDLLAPLAAAVRAEGLKFGLYYSQSQDWTHPGGAKYGNNRSWDPAQDGNYDDYLKNIALPQTKEIVERYKPAIIWWDTPIHMTPGRVKPFADYMAQHPGIISNNRLGDGFKGDTKTPEQHIPPRGYPGERFEVCMTMNDSWGYKKNDQNWKNVRQILRNLSDISSKGGNFLLNVGPDAEGVIPPASVEILQSVGRWMGVNQEAIYGTTASPFPRRLPWGRVTQKSTAAGTILFIHVWEWPAGHQLLLPTLKEVPTQGKVLASGATVKAKNTPDGLLLQLPQSAPDPDVSVIRLDFPGAVTVTMDPFITPDQAGRIHFNAQDADAHGDYGGNIQLRNTGPDAFLTDWKDSKWYLEYELKTPQAQKWVVTAEVAATDPVKLSLGADKASTSVEVPATGPGTTWKTIKLGTIKLPAGESKFRLNAVANGWEGISIRNVWLDKASPYLLPDDRGVFLLNANDADLTGKLQLESGHVGYWTNPADTVSWQVAIPKAGTYKVSIEYACEESSKDSEYEVKIGSKTVTGKVAGTGSFTKFDTKELGIVQFEKAEGLTVTVKATKKPGLAVMNLRSITLTALN
ncbi:MAG: alpha-L-fucosidase [Luteolibacter sp.]